MPPSFGEPMKLCAAANAEGAAEMVGKLHAAVDARPAVKEMSQITTRVPGVHMTNMVEGGLTPILTRRELADLGFAHRAVCERRHARSGVGMRAVLQHLAKHGDTRAAEDLMISWRDRQDLVGKPEFDELDVRYAVKEEK
jgi:2-methylisocitrate lyase-like PEP mutase family enzyme